MGDTRTPITVEVHDWRILGATLPRRPDYVPFYVSPIATIWDVLAGVANALQGNRRIGKLKILAHGMHTNEKMGNATPLVGVMLGSSMIHGGFTVTGKDHGYTDEYGVTLKLPEGRCNETLSLWGRFKGYIDEIRFLSCGAASHHLAVGPADFIKPDISGYEMCRRFARITGAYVMAAKLYQRFEYGTLDGNPVASRRSPNYNEQAITDFGPWEGPVVVLNPAGDEVGYSPGGDPPTYRRGS